MKKYSIIYADPPWAYKDKMSGHSFSLENEYKTQSKDWIAKLSVGSISATDSILFLWAVSPQLPEALQVMKAWGFKYTTIAFVWSKNTKNGKKVSNLGRWTMGNVEVCLLGIKGKPNRLRLDKSIKQLVEAERTVHSKKPSEVRERIIKMVGDVPKIELFARQKTMGWDVWGDEVASDIML